MAGLTGLEPAASRVTGERYNHLTTTPNEIIAEPQSIQNGRVIRKSFLLTRGKNLLSLHFEQSIGKMS